MSLPEQGPGGRGGRSTRALSLSRLMKLDGLTALDLGSHEGYNSLDLFESGCSKVLGVEIRDRFIEAAEKEVRRLGYHGTSFLKADARKIDEAGVGHFDLCLCTGLLYHMQNPYNLLKRLRNMCRMLALETHLAPHTLWNLFRAGKKYRANLTWTRRTAILDGEKFSGRLNIFPSSQDMQRTSGSVISNATFWLDRESLLKALDLAGFHVKAVYFGATPEGYPDILVDHGPNRTKVFILAEVHAPDVAMIPVQESRIEGCSLLTV